MDSPTGLWLPQDIARTEPVSDGPSMTKGPNRTERRRIDKLVRRDQKRRIKGATSKH